MANHSGRRDVAADDLDLRFKRHFNSARITPKAVQDQSAETSTATQARHAAGKRDVAMSIDDLLVMHYATEFGVVSRGEEDPEVQKRVEDTVRARVEDLAPCRRRLLTAAADARPDASLDASSDSSLDSSLDPGAVSEESGPVSSRSASARASRRASQDSSSLASPARAAHVAAGGTSGKAARLAGMRGKKRAREEERQRRLEGEGSERATTRILNSRFRRATPDPRA